jgi:hypothetical protein
MQHAREHVASKANFPACGVVLWTENDAANRQVWTVHVGRQR